MQKVISNEKNYEIIFVGPNEKDSDDWMSNHYVDGAKRIWYYGHYVRKLYSYVRNEKPSIVHISFEWRMFGPLTASLKFPFLLLLLRFGTRAKIMMDFRSPMISKEDSQWKIMDDIIPMKIPRFILEAFMKIFVRSVCGLCHKVVVDAGGNKLGMIEFYGINAEKIEVNKLLLPKKPMVDNFDKSKKYHEQFKNKKIILCFGVISKRKSYDLIIKAFNAISDKLPDHVLVFAGLTTEDAKPYENMLHEMIEKFGLNSKAFFTGYVDDEEAHILFEMAEIALYIYRPYPESSGALFFAIHHYTPSVVTNSETFTQVLQK
ncbi:MAG: glycosyltransferase, partial [Patescibacteria group bacterium]|nr:glycosyltransferase [Patescibacteria group bacterium]